MIELVKGRKYHVSWAKKECVWILKDFDDINATLTTKRGKVIVTKISTLQDVNANKQPQNTP